MRRKRSTSAQPTPQEQVGPSSEGQGPQEPGKPPSEEQGPEGTGQPSGEEQQPGRRKLFPGVMRRKRSTSAQPTPQEQVGPSSEGQGPQEPGKPPSEEQGPGGSGQTSGEEHQPGRRKLLPGVMRRKRSPSAQPTPQEQVGPSSEGQGPQEPGQPPSEEQGPGGSEQPSGEEQQRGRRKLLPGVMRRKRSTSAQPTPQEQVGPSSEGQGPQAPGQPPSEEQKSEEPGKPGEEQKQGRRKLLPGFVPRKRSSSKRQTPQPQEKPSDEEERAVEPGRPPSVEQGPQEQSKPFSEGQGPQEPGKHPSEEQGPEGSGQPSGEEQQRGRRKLLPGFMPRRKSSSKRQAGRSSSGEPTPVEPERHSGEKEGPQEARKPTSTEQTPERLQKRGSRRRRSSGFLPKPLRRRSSSAQRAPSTDRSGSTAARASTSRIMRKCQCPFHHDMDPQGTSPHAAIVSSYVDSDLNNETNLNQAHKYPAYRHRGHRAKPSTSSAASEDARAPVKERKKRSSVFSRPRKEKGRGHKRGRSKTAAAEPGEEEFPEVPPDMASHIVVCHGETVNEIFPQWLRLSYKGGSYQPYDLNMPAVIPKRPMEHFRFDPPLTEHGYLTAEFVGKAFKMAGYSPKIIYSSPELRCVQTSAAIARACGNTSPICLEPALADWVQLSPPSTPQHWLTPDRYKNLDVPVNTDYKPHLSELPKKESPDDYWKRLEDFFRTIYRPADKVILIVANPSALDMAINRRWHSGGEICESKKYVRNCAFHELRVERDKKMHVVVPNVLPFTKTPKEARGKIAT
uniref:Myosin XVB n=1 Tax=Haemonchus contortus TaxID=6289 RepID=A0A7I5E9S1_HAECO